MHEEHDNSMATRTTGAIALRPTGNTQGSYLFYSLDTGRVLTRNQWTALPMPNEVIDHVQALARRDQANVAGLVFGDRHKNPLMDVSADFDEDHDAHISEGPDACHPNEINWDEYDLLDPALIDPEVSTVTNMDRTAIDDIAGVNNPQPMVVPTPIFSMKNPSMLTTMVI
jgi:hypothetical protein